MKKNVPVPFLILAAALLASPRAARSEEPTSDQQSSIRFREEFLAEFKHIVLDTAAEDAMLLRILVEMSQAQRGVEVGTCRGFGAMNMGIAFERTGGRLETVDISPTMVKTARANLKTLALHDVVTVIEGDALTVLPSLTADYDFAFLDAVKIDYLNYFKAIEDNLTPGAVVIADNTIRSASSMRDFLGYLEKSPLYDTVTMRVSMKKNDGMTLACRIPKTAAFSDATRKRRSEISCVPRPTTCPESG